MSDRITLTNSFAADAEGLKNVSLITTGIEAAGHGIYLDEKTAETAMKRLLGRSVKSYLKHDGAGGDRLGQEIGFFSGVYRAGQQIKATAFQFLESFRKEAGAIADRLIEMAQKAPDQFGVSLVLEYMPVWVLPDGSEVQASRGEPAPEGALYGMPVMRVLDVISADFVGRPAANPNGLLSADATQSAIEAKSQSTDSTKMDSETSAAATAETTSLETVTTAGTTTIAATVVDVAALDTLKAEHATALAAKDGEIATLTAKLAEFEQAHVATLAEKDARIAELSATMATGEDELVGALDELEQAEAKIAQDAEKIADLAAYDIRKLGVPPLKIASMQAAQAAAALSTPQQKWEHYEKLPEGSKERRAFAAKHYDALNAHFQTISAAK